MTRLVLWWSLQRLSILAAAQALVRDSRLSWVSVELSSNSPLALRRCTPPSRVKVPAAVLRTLICPKALVGEALSSWLVLEKYGEKRLSVGFWAPKVCCTLRPERSRPAVEAESSTETFG